MARLAVTHAISGDDLGKLARLSAADDSYDDLRAEIRRLFDTIDVRPNKRPSEVDALEILADLDEAVTVAVAQRKRPLPTFAELSAAKVKRPQKCNPALRAQGLLRDRHGNAIESPRDLADCFAAAAPLKVCVKARLRDGQERYRDHSQSSGGEVGEDEGVCPGDAVP